MKTLSRNENLTFKNIQSIEKALKLEKRVEDKPIESPTTRRFTPTGDSFEESHVLQPFATNTEGLFQETIALFLHPFCPSVQCRVEIQPM